MQQQEGVDGGRAEHEHHGIEVWKCEARDDETDGEHRGQLHVEPGAPACPVGRHGRRHYGDQQEKRDNRGHVVGIKRAGHAAHGNETRRCDQDATDAPTFAEVLCGHRSVE